MKKKIYNWEKAIVQGNFFTIERSRIDGSSLYGIPVKAGNTLLMVESLYDYIADGYRVIRKKDITKVKHGKSEKLAEKIIALDEIEHGVNLPPMEGLEGMREILMHYAASRENIIVECESADKNRFLIGKVAGCKKNTFLFWHFNGAGVWEKKPIKVSYADVSCITIGSRYLEVISKHVKPFSFTEEIGNPS